MESFSYYIKNNIPFLFIIDYENKNRHFIPLDEAAENNIYYDFEGKTNFTEKSEKPALPDEIRFEKSPVSYSEYLKAFSTVHDNLADGYSYLANLTFRTPIEINLTLKEIFTHSKAKYKLLFKDSFVVFSPEAFIRIKNNSVFTYPMKGTIDAAVPDAENVLLDDEKETAEHVTIVDLLRNDLNMISDNVRVENFRYIDRLKTNFKELLQVSSVITGDLAPGYQDKLDDLFEKILPAGSITGAPKKKTVEIIKSAENYDRGYYTGVFGYYDSGTLESAVMIRFIEKEDENYFFKSGGGITIYSDPEKEYQELIDKIYVPVY